MEEKQLEIRDQRDRGWYWSNNEFLNGYVRFIGVYANGVYNSLCRHADKKQKCWPSIETICEELGIGKNSVVESIKRLEFWQIITKVRVGKMCNNRYILNNKKEWKPISEVYLKEFSEVCHINFKGLSDKLHRFARQTSNSNKTHSNKTHSKSSKTKVLPSSFKKKKNQEITELFDYYKQEFKKMTGKTPIFNWGKCARLAKPHLETLGLKTMKHLVYCYLYETKGEDRKFFKENVWSLSCFLSANTINKINLKYYESN